MAERRADSPFREEVVSLSHRADVSLASKENNRSKEIGTSGVVTRVRVVVVAVRNEKYFSLILSHPVNRCTYKERMREREARTVEEAEEVWTRKSQESGQHEMTKNDELLLPYVFYYVFVEIVESDLFHCSLYAWE